LNGQNPEPGTPSPSSDDPCIIEAVEEYLRLCEARNPPGVDAFVAARPEIADRLRQCLAGLELVQAAVPEIEASADGLARLTFAESLVGKPLGDYRIIREVGRGGMGVVFEAEQISLGRRVALKVLPLASMLDERQLQRFRNEARAAASLDHPNIVEVYAVGCERGVHFYAMRYVEGQTLAAVIEGLKDEGRITKDESRITKDEIVGADSRPRPAPAPSAQPPASRSLRPSATETSPIAALSTLRESNPRDFYRTVAALGIQAAEALDHAHLLGIVHRDIKPANLIVECSHLAPRNETSRAPSLQTPASTPHLYITDFGLAQVRVEPGSPALTMTGDLLGTLRYMSPEQAAGEKLLDQRTDIYSLGVTLYELLTLRPAFPETDRTKLLRQITEQEPTLPRQIKPSIPVDLETIILKAIAKNPSDRYGNAQDVARDLARFLDNQPIQARRPTPLQRLKRWTQRHAGAVAALAFLFLLTTAIAATAAALVLQARESESAALGHARPTKWPKLPKSGLPINRTWSRCTRNSFSNRWLSTTGWQNSMAMILMHSLKSLARTAVRGRCMIGCRMCRRRGSPFGPQSQ
jgi:serine/threonine protein kinase